MKRLVIIDDEPAICQSLQFALEDWYEIYAFLDPHEALQLFARTEIALVLLDLKIGSQDGIEILQAIKQVSPHTVVIMMTAYGSISSSVEAMRRGAFYYITKPFPTNELEALLQNAEEFYDLHSKVLWLSEELEKLSEGFGLIGKSPSMTRVLELIEKIKNIDSNVLITGESGTGKEVVARAIHFQGNRRSKRFQALNCAAIPEKLLESELFGYEKGAFTGAIQKKPGQFVLAEGGTIFLDEIAEMELALQGKLLRVVQERKVTPLGSTEEKPIHVRIVAASNRDLHKEVKAGRLREDLYYRLNVIPIHLPPLRERREDIPLLTQYFIRKLSERMGKPMDGISNEAQQLLTSYAFPGNVRELQNIIERAIALTNSENIQKRDLPQEMQGLRPIHREQKLIPIYIGETLEEVERKVILHNLSANGGNRRKTAQVIGIGERTIREKLRSYEEE